MEFLIVPLIFGISLLLLSLGKLLGKDKTVTSCSSGDCETCVLPQEKENVFSDEAGLANLARLPDPNRKVRYVEQLDFHPEKL